MRTNNIRNSSNTHAKKKLKRMFILVCVCLFFVFFLPASRFLDKHRREHELVHGSEIQSLFSISTPNTLAHNEVCFVLVPYLFFHAYL